MFYEVKSLIFKISPIVEMTRRLHSKCFAISNAVRNLYFLDLSIAEITGRYSDKSEDAACNFFSSLRSFVASCHPLYSKNLSSLGFGKNRLAKYPTTIITK